MAAPNKLYVALLELELAQARHRHNVVLAALLQEADKEGLTRRQRRWWVRDWILQRPVFGQYDTLMRELEAQHAADFKSFLRMEPALWHELLDRVGTRITKSTR